MKKNKLKLQMLPSVAAVDLHLAFRTISSVRSFVLAILIGLLSACSGSTSGSLSKSPTNNSPMLVTISPLTKAVSLGGTVDFKASGGEEPYSFDIYYGSGNIQASGNSGVYQAPQAESTAVVRVQDKNGNMGYGTVEVTNAPVIEPSSKTLAVGNEFPFSVINTAVR